MGLKIYQWILQEVVRLRDPPIHSIQQSWRIVLEYPRPKVGANHRPNKIADEL